MDNLTLIGMPGCGKSTIGVVLAKTLGYEFVDVDLIIQKQQGALLQELLDTHGTQAFLDMERDAVLSVQCAHTVIAPGGSVVLREEGMAHLKTLGKIVYLRLSLPAVTRRISNLADRGIAFGPGQTLADVYAQRTPLYERWADITIDADGQHVSQTLQTVRDAISL